jgi:hypothetical protein
LNAKNKYEEKVIEIEEIVNVGDDEEEDVNEEMILQDHENEDNIDFDYGDEVN